ncbi:MAG: hypothetical protein D6706_20315 [Chloroflexi bacterium]|nr:MAG: hypothetical protein D6706_20315 [Chloroflexota bacterium]
MVKLAEIVFGETIEVNRPRPVAIKKEPAQSVVRTKSRYITIKNLPPISADILHQYKPIPADAIKTFQLKIGTLPEWQYKCRHDRLIVPIVRPDGTIHHIRGRALADCKPDCPKWLASKGWTTADMPLPPGGIPVQTNDVVVMVENAIDAMMVTYHPEFVFELIRYKLTTKVLHGLVNGGNIKGAAVLASTYWSDLWIPVLKPASQVVIVLDNDPAGIKASVRLANKLNKNGILAVVHKWNNGKEKYDMGDYLKDCLQKGE